MVDLLESFQAFLASGNKSYLGFYCVQRVETLFKTFPGAASQVLREKLQRCFEPRSGPSWYWLRVSETGWALRNVVEFIIPTGVS